MSSQPRRVGTDTPKRREQNKRYITVVLTDDDRKRLCGRVATAHGGLQSLLRRLQGGVRITERGAELTLIESDTDRVAWYWARTGSKPGSGGYQRMLPIDSLREYLPTVAPLFGAVEPPRRKGKSWVYFKQDRRNLKIKIGRGNSKRASSYRPTENPNYLTVLLRVEETEEKDEGYYQRLFKKHHIVNEWFWPHDELLEFIDAEAAKQELQEQRCSHDTSTSR